MPLPDEEMEGRSHKRKFSFGLKNNGTVQRRFFSSFNERSKFTCVSYFINETSVVCQSNFMFVLVKRCGGVISE